MKQKIKRLIDKYKKLLLSYRGRPRYVLENVIEDLEQLLKEL